MEVLPVWVFLLTVFLDNGHYVLSSGGGFGYDGELGPEHWAEHFPNCGGKRQSPIDVELHKLRIRSNGPLSWGNYFDDPDLMNLQNNGHTVKLTVMNENDPYTLRGGALGGDYIFQELHFHWGRDSSEGSEHTFHGRRFPLEAHVVHYKSEYQNFTNAQNYEDGIAVVALLYKISKFDNTAFEEIVEALPSVQEAGSNVALRPHPLSWFTEEFEHKYVYYEGSLTTPPCSEVVTWIVYTKTVDISERQVAEFRKIRNEEGQPIEHSFRPTQPLNGRTIFYDP